MSLPLISIIIPCYNSEKTIRACLDSLLCQSYTYWEAICVDDGSTDTTYLVLDTYRKKDQRIKIFSNTNQGAAGARVEGISHISGEFVTFVDSDDTIEGDFLTFLFQSFDSDVDIVITGFNTFDKTNKKCLRSYKEALLDRNRYIKEVLTGNYGWELCGKLFRADLFKEKLFTPKNLCIGEDALHFFQILTVTKKVYVVNRSLYNYRNTQNSASKVKSDELADQTLLAAFYIEKFLKNRLDCSALKNELDAMHLLFYSNATRRKKSLFWFSPSVEKIYRERLSLSSLLQIQRMKACYILFSLELTNLYHFIKRLFFRLY